MAGHLCHIHDSTQNLYEYPGIRLLYELALHNPEGVYLYFHSKGMVYHNQSSRLPQEMVLFQSVVAQWRKVLGIFKEQLHINKVGYGASYAGFMWGTFFYARGEYLARCQPPVVSTDRYVFESWIGHCGPCMSYIDCYSLQSDNQKQYYTPGEVTDAWDAEALTLNA
jgi:hypothetical protein